MKIPYLLKLNLIEFLYSLKLFFIIGRERDLQPVLEVLGKVNLISENSKITT